MSNIEKHSIPPHESESIEKNNGIFGLLEMCGVKKSRTESNANPHLVMDDHSTGRLLPRTVGTDEIEEERLSTSNCLSSQMKYESRTEPDTYPYLVMDDHPTGRFLSRTIGRDEIEAHRLSINKYLTFQMGLQPKTESKAGPYKVMIDHPTGRLLSKTIGTDESTSEYLPSQMKYEPGDCPRKTYDDPKNRIVTGYSLDLPKLLDSRTSLDLILKKRQLQ